MEYRKIYESWLNDSYIDDVTKTELRSIENNESDIEERFYKHLEFGTGGLRGIIGAGTSRMNVYTVRNATQGLANYILKQGGNVREMGVCIAHDSRRMSPEFTREAALCLNGNGIKTYIYESLRPTPQLSFTVRELGCVAGIVITASHNPPEYNGYKAYWSDGGQVTYPKDVDIIDEVNEVTSFSQIKTMSEEKAVEAGLFNVLGRDMDDKYMEAVMKNSMNHELVKKNPDSLKIVYTPLNGAGNIPVRRALSEVGFKNVYVVPEQEMPDPDFTTIGYPNPEDPKAFTLALELAKEKNADIIIGTDPDSDRVGAIVLHNGEYRILNGNMTGVLLCEYVLSQKKAKGELPENAAVVSTIVSSNMTKQIAKAYNTKYFEVLTGFKYIGEKIKMFEQEKSYQFMMGFEESYGYLAGTHARDKDAVVSAMLICELAAVLKLQGKTLIDGLDDLYEKYGYYKELNESITLKGLEGVRAIKKIMTNLRENIPTSIGDDKILAVGDYHVGYVSDLINNSKNLIELPKSDILYYELSDDEWFCVRPSGTEPKIKIYYGVRGKNHEDADARLRILSENARNLVNSANI